MEKNSAVINLQQYWFTEESLTVIVKAIEMSGCDGVLCIGTPTVFEYFQSNGLLRKKIKSFLLDIDIRFVSFPPRPFYH